MQIKSNFEFHFSWIGVVLVLLAAALLIFLVQGCQSKIHFVQKSGCTGVDFCESVAEATYKGRPKDLYDTDFSWPTPDGPMRFRTGKAVTTEDPWAEVIGEVAGPLVKQAFCKQNPLLCVDGELK